MVSVESPPIVAVLHRADSAQHLPVDRILLRSSGGYGDGRPSVIARQPSEQHFTTISMGARPAALADLLFAAETDRVFADSGHSLDFINKAFECLCSKPPIWQPAYHGATGFMRMPDCRAAKKISGSWGDGSARSHLFIAPGKPGGRMRSDHVLKLPVSRIWKEYGVATCIS
jgi:hypothetical protein